MDVSQGRGNPRMVDCQAVGAATFNNAARWNVKRGRWWGFTTDQSLKQVSAFVADLFQVIVDA
ncbi:MAG: hypothetical protein ACYS80_06050 [Planctomycetota bacterium]